MQNLPVRIYKNNNVFEYIYDANGNRVSKIESGNTVWNYAYGANGKTEARIQDSQDLIKHNLWGNDLLGITESISSSTDEKYYFLKDHLGSIKMRLFEDGTVAGYDDYYPFGMILNGRSSSTGSTEEYKFTGKERDTETGLDYFGARQYDSKIGRWLSVDPLADKYPGWSPYHYCLNNPIRGVDPDGRGFWDIVSGVSNSLSDNNTMGLTKARANANYENSSHGRIGEQIGNVLSLVQSGAEFLTGGTMVGGGGALTIGGAATGPGELVLAPAGIATTAAGVAVIADAIGVGAVALNNMMEGNNGGGYDQPASRNEQGRPQADPEAQGPHSTLSTRNGEKQGHTFNKEGQLESEVSPFDKRHGPHEHKYNNSDPQNPVRGKWEPLKKDN
ncbi:MAG: RHS repeat-associated core domain-containing protein [Ignavibacteriae bacterium]|nr:RHS repeat-associated core domain-containing protein [Ignavibacteriota bacterium]